jgi:integrase
VTLILGTGMRVPELNNLHWSDVNLAHHYLTVVSGKGRSTRCIPFGPRALGAIIHQRCRHYGSQYVLGDCRHSLLKKAARIVQSLIPSACRRAITLYDLRTVFARRWIRDGGGPESLAYVTAQPIRGPRLSIRVVDQACLDAAMLHVSRLWKNRIRTVKKSPTMGSIPIDSRMEGPLE